MAKLRDSKLRETTGAYERLFGIPALGMLISRVQSTVISSGNELEGSILEKAQNPIGDCCVTRRASTEAITSDLNTSI